MAYTRGRCSNFDYCSLADARRDIEVLVGEDFVCPECGKPLRAPPVQAGRGGVARPLLIGGGMLVLVGGAVFLGMRMGGAPPSPSAPAMMAAKAPAALQPAPPGAPGTASPGTTAVPPAASVLAHLAGSASLGAQLVPSLAAAYLAQNGDSGVKTEPGAAAGEARVAGQRGDQHESILVESSNAAAGFKLLGTGGADAVFATRRILPAEKDSLASLGDLTTPAAEHVIALDGLAIIVNPDNRVSSLTKDQIRGLFTGTIGDWSTLGGPAGPVNVYALDPQSDIGAVFSSMALSGAPLSPSAKPLPNGRLVSQAVSADPHGIGVVDLANILQAHALPIGDTGSNPVSPTNPAAIASEDYPLTYRVYLYTSPKAAGGIGQRLVDFAASANGQAIIEQQGLVSPTAKPAAPAAAATPPAPAASTPTDRLKQIVQGAKKLAVDFRFTPNSSGLDLKGSRDIDRVTNYLLSMHYTGQHLILVGFADNQGNPDANIAVSKKRADALAVMFAQRGLSPAKVVGFGADLPLADNATEDGRQKNRRVEVYILP